MKTYVRPTTAQELRAELLNLMQGEAWRQLSTNQHEAVALIKQAAESLRNL